jgi:hypothetical protein
VREIVGEAQAILLRLARPPENQWSGRMSVSVALFGHGAMSNFSGVARMEPTVGANGSRECAPDDRLRGVRWRNPGRDAAEAPDFARAPSGLRAAAQPVVGRLRWEHIQRIYEMCNRNVSEAARRLNIIAAPCSASWPSARRGNTRSLPGLTHGCPVQFWWTKSGHDACMCVGYFGGSLGSASRSRHFGQVIFRP